MARMPSSSPCPHSPRTNRRHRGVTLLELVVAMSVLAILTAVGIPSFRALQKRSQVDATLHLLTSHFASARITAITHNVPVVVCPSRGDGTCRQDSDWSEHWLTFRDPDGNRQPDDTFDVFRNEPAPHAPGLRLLSTAGRRQVRYLPTGYSSGNNLTVRLCIDGEVSGLVVINNAGRIRSARPSEPEPCVPPG